MLKNFFDSSFMDKALEKYGLTRQQNYPDLQLLLQKYKIRLKNSSKLSGRWFLGQIYKEKIVIDEQNFYTVAWNVAASKKAIRKYNLPEQNFYLEDMIKLVNPNYIDKSHLKTALNNNTPIFVAAYPQAIDNKLIIIDGNHRVTAKYQHRRGEIPGYLLEPQQHMEAMVSENHRTLFKIHFNYYQLAAYLAGKLSKKELEASLYPL